MVGTRGVLAVMAGGTMIIAIAAMRSGRKQMGLWLLTTAFFIASIWSGLSVVWAREYPNQSAIPAESHLVLGTTAVAGAIYYGMLARESVN
ncbi:hypothetical protein [Haladaptatus sp. NG-SE-30]